MYHSLQVVAKSYSDISNDRKDVKRFDYTNFLHFAKQNQTKYCLLESGDDLCVSTWHFNDLISDYKSTIQIERIIVDNVLFEVGDQIRIKGDPTIGTIIEIKYSGYFEEYRKFILMVKWMDDGVVCSTPTKHFFEVMEFVKK